MCSKYSLLVFFALMTGTALASDVTPNDGNAARATNTGMPEFSLSPSKCVALNEGRTCFADVSFSLTLPDQREYCVREMGEVTPIGCWRAAETVSYLYSFAQSASTTYELVDRAKGAVIATQTIEVNWVHKIQTKKRRWRLF